MTNLKKEIGWEKYETPFKHVLRQYQQEQGQSEGNWSDQEITGKSESEYAGPVLMTPLGVLPLNETTLIDNQFNFWIMHTNFPITTLVYNAAVTVPGIEEFRVLTPYRARLAFAKLFDEKQVKLELKNMLCGKNIVKSQITEDRAKSLIQSKLTDGKTVNLVNNLLTITHSG